MDTQQVVTVFTAFLVAAVPVALLVTKGVDLARGLIDPSGKYTGTKGWVWNVLAFVVGVGICLGWQFNPFGGFVHAIPALANDTHLDGVAGQVLSGLAVGAMGGFWHAKLAQWGAFTQAKRAGK